MRLLIMSTLAATLLGGGAALAESYDCTNVDTGFVKIYELRPAEQRVILVRSQTADGSQQWNDPSEQTVLFWSDQQIAFYANSELAHNLVVFDRVGSRARQEAIYKDLSQTYEQSYSCAPM